MIAENTIKMIKNYKNQGLTPVIGTSSSGEADSTTKSAIAEGTVEIRSNPDQDLTGISRDTQNSLNTLEKIFDRKTVAEQQELAQLFGEVAFKAIGDLGLKEGSPEKAALDMVLGGIMSKVGGGKFAEGAASAGLTQLVMNELKNIKDPVLLQWATAIVGAAAAKVVGGNAQTGASVAVSEVRNNWLSHWQKEERQKAIDEEDWEKVAYWDRIDEAQDQIFNSMGINPNLIDWTDPINSKLLESISNQARELKASSNFQNSFLENLPTVDYSTIVATGAISVVVVGAVLYKYNGSWVKASSPIAIGVGKWGEATFQNESKLVDHFVRHEK
ncbi:hypothetical protein [Anaerosinus sp.]|uniref:hypothetical protein n=1 Tax=Selenobaculum sp. TaxID=3074374 RepID=UPI003AB4BE81